LLQAGLVLLHVDNLLDGVLQAILRHVLVQLPLLQAGQGQDVLNIEEKQLDGALADY